MTPLHVSTPKERTIMTHIDDAKSANLRHCSVCFCLIQNDSAPKKTMEGRYYCDACSSEVFKTGELERYSAIPCCRPGQTPPA